MIAELVQDEVIKKIMEKVEEEIKKFPSDELSDEEVKKRDIYLTNYRFPILKKPYCNDATSLSRLISFDQTCGCIYIDNKDESISFSTNYHPNDESKSNRKRMKKDKFKKFIEPKLKNLINGNFREEDKAELFRATFDCMVSTIAKKYRWIVNDIIKKKEYCEDQASEISVARLIDSEIYHKSDWEDKNLEDIREIHQKLNYFLEKFDFGKENPYENKLYASVMKIAIILDDIEKMCSNLKDNKILCKAIINDEIKRAECRGKVGILHCEQRMLEHISSKYGNGYISEEVFSNLKEAVEDKRFTVSKFCCWYCYLIFRKLSNVLNENENSLDKLGHSCCFFPGWNSPSFEDDENFRKIKNEIEEEIIKETDSKDFAKNMMLSVDEMILENSLVNLVPQPF